MSDASKFPYFSEENSVGAVNARIDQAKANPRLANVMEALTKHLHAFIKEVEPTHDEWMTGIKFLTDTGHMCTEWRQEFILLSDTLGVSSRVDTVNHRSGNGATEHTILGPFHLPDAPVLEVPDGKEDQHRLGHHWADRAAGDDRCPLDWSRRRSAP